MIDQNKIHYRRVDLESINKNQPISCEKKKERRFSLSFFYNIFNKAFKINFKWRF